MGPILALAPGIRPSRLLANDYADASRESIAGSIDAGHDRAAPPSQRPIRAYNGGEPRRLPTQEHQDAPSPQSPDHGARPARRPRGGRTRAAAS